MSNLDIRSEHEWDGMRPSSGAETREATRAVENSNTSWHLDLAAPGDGRTPGSSSSRNAHACLSSGEEAEKVLLGRAAAWPDHAALESLDAARLRHITNEHGVDFATALLFDRFRKSPRHAAFIQRMDELLGDPPVRERLCIDARVVIVPGALYVERPDMGGDGRMIREVAEGFGCRSGLVPLASRGSVSENARRLLGWLEQQRDERLILVSLSKGGADLKAALASPDASSLFRHVVAWINVCGPLDGSAMANWVFSSRVRSALLRFQFWLQRRDIRFVAELRRGAEGILDQPPRLPETMKMVSLVGFPLRRHMTTPFSRFCHARLTDCGPNDGTVSLADVCAWPGLIYPVWGVDHYFRPERMARALIGSVLRYLAQ